ncbi:MAG: methyltransferase domain-containing protein [Pseudomonadota bacterium]
MRSDQQRWEGRYRDGIAESPAANALLIDHAHLLTSGRALDAAAGRGANSLFAGRHGYLVDAMDISLAAMTELKARSREQGSPINPIVADLDYQPLPEGMYDLVMVFYFFATGLLQPLARSLRSDGLLFYATYNYRHRTLKPGFNAAYLVPAGGLRPFFPGLEILLDEPEAGENGAESRLIARMPRNLSL